MSDDDTQQDPNPLTQTRFLVAAVVVVAIVVLGVVIAVRGPGNDPQAAVAPTVTAAATPNPDDPQTSVCGLPAGDQTPPATTPDTSWELVGTTAVPSDPKTVGPGVETDTVRSCFAHTPVGALYAATSYLAASDVPEMVGPTTKEMAADGAGRDLVLKALEAAGGTANYVSGTRVQTAGYTFLSYTPQETTLDIAYRLNASGYTSYSITLVWQDQDWKVQISGAGRPFTKNGALPDLAGYVQWSGA